MAFSCPVGRAFPGSTSFCVRSSAYFTQGAGGHPVADTAYAASTSTTKGGRPLHQTSTANR